MITAGSIKKSVLVTGASGFVGSHCVLQLLGAGYSVRATVRSLSKKDDLIKKLQWAGVSAFDDLSFIGANLTDDENWAQAVHGCEYVLHVATPISLSLPQNEDEVIRPAVEGTLRVLRAAAHDGGVKRVVLTSSFAAIGYGNNPGTRLFDESDWTNLDKKGLSSYVKSKALAERAAWDFMNTEGRTLELTVVNPMAIFGPILGEGSSSGHDLLKNLMNGSMNFVPNLDFGIVDVRDVADLHLRAMTHPKAAGQRFLALAGGTMTFHEIAMTLREHFGKEAELVPTRVIADWKIRLAALFSAKARQLLPMLGQVRNASNAKARNELGWSPRPNREAVIAAGESILRLGLNKKA